MFDVLVLREAHPSYTPLIRLTALVDAIFPLILMIGSGYPLAQQVVIKASPTYMVDDEVVKLAIWGGTAHKNIIARNAMTRTQRLLVTFYFFSVDRFV